MRDVLIVESVAHSPIQGVSSLIREGYVSLDEVITRFKEYKMKEEALEWQRIE